MKQYKAEQIPLSKHSGKHMDIFGLISMANAVRSRTFLMSGNGRIYDPDLSRFISPDPYVQMPDNSQNFNRYSYALNNPLKYTDPSGEWAWLPFAIYGSLNMGLRAGVAAENAGGDFWSDGFWKGAIAGFASGAAGAFSGAAAVESFGVQGIIPGALVGGTTGAATGGLTGGMTSWAMGNGFWDGAQQGAMIGGVTGMIGGGFQGAINARAMSKNPWTLNVEYPELTSSPVLHTNIKEVDIANIYHGTPNIRSGNQTITVGNINGGNGIYSYKELNNLYANSQLKLIGKPYIYGANGPSAFDCSGAPCYSLRNIANPKFGDYTAHQLFEKYTLPTNKLSKGNLIFYDYQSDGIIDHMTSLVSKLQMIHPSSGAGLIQLKSINYLNDYGNNTSTYLREWNWLKLLK